MSERPSDLKFELKNVLLAVEDVVDWYDLGLQLGLPDSTLASISKHPDYDGRLRMMLSKWLQTDTEASWEKLAAALDAIKRRVIAANIRRQFLGIVSPQPTVAPHPIVPPQAIVSQQPIVSPQHVVEQPPQEDEKQAMTETALRKTRSNFSDLVVKVRTSLEAYNTKVKDVRDFLVTYFEGECNIPKGSDLSAIFECLTSTKLWRYDHYGPLEELVEKFLPKDDPARALMSEYVSKLSAFYTTTSIIDFIKISEFDDLEEDNQIFSPKKYNRQYRKLTVKLKLKKKVSELTLDFVDTIWKALQREFDLPSLTAVIDKILEGSLTITWLVLPHIVEKIKYKFSKSLNFLQHHGIVHIELYGVLELPLYDEEWMEGSTPLYRACFSGDSEAVEDLLEGGPNVNQENDNSFGDTPLNGASSNGHVHIVRMLLSRGAMLDHQNKAGESALILASNYGHSEVAEVLLEHGATVDIQNDGGDSALMVASLYGHSEVAEVLLEHGATVDIQNDARRTALMYACIFGYTDITTMLLDHGAVIDLCDKNETSALMQASAGSHPATVKLLLERGATVDLSDNNGFTALIYASGCGQAITARVLLQHGAVVDHKIKDGATPLYVASQEGHHDVVEVLLISGATIDLPVDDEDGDTPLMVACQEGHAGTAKVLLDKGAFIDFQDKKSRSPLILACVGGHEGTVKVLLERKAQVDLQNEDGWTALFFTARGGQVELVKMLLDHGASVDIKSNSGLTAFDVAESESQQAVCQQLAEYSQQNVKVVTPESAPSHQATESSVQQPETKTGPTEQQREELRSVGEQIWDLFKRTFLREVVKKEEQTSQHGGEGTTGHIMGRPKGRRSFLNRVWPRRRRRQVVGTAPAPDH